MSKINRNGMQGFTLVEAVMSVMIMSFALGACILSFSLAMRIVGTGENQMTALHQARYEVEQLRLYSCTNNGALSAGTHVFTNGTYGAGTYTVSNVNSATKSIAVTVTYLNRVHEYSSTNTLTTCIVTTLHP